MRQRIGQPISVDDIELEDPNVELALARKHDEITRAVQALLDSALADKD